MRILIAPNAFKNGLTAAEAADAIRDGLLADNPDHTCIVFPIGDGGDGTWQLLADHAGADTIKHWSHDPLGRPIIARYGLHTASQTAYIGVAEASGLRLLAENEHDPFRATTYGTGELIKHALDHHARSVILSVGGSATIDGGKGILEALGMRFRRQANGAFRADVSAMHSRVAYSDFVILCDVKNPLLGEHGAATVFGPQKGAKKDDIPKLEEWLTHWAAGAQRFSGVDIGSVPSGGAAGGVAAGLAAFLDAKLVNGADHFLKMTGFYEELLKADIVITGEGSLDRQTLLGKGPYAVAERAKKLGIPAIGLAGVVEDESRAALGDYFSRLIPINPPGQDVTTAIRSTRENLFNAAKSLSATL